MRPEEKILEMADHYEIPILFHHNVEVDEQSIKLKWSDGRHFIYSVNVFPELINDDQQITLNHSRLKSTIINPPQ